MPLPRLNVTCGRCGKPRSLRHVCVSSRNRKATVKTSWSFGTCPKCRKTITNPLNHTCRPKSDFKARKRAADKAKPQRATNRPQHDYQACGDRSCPRPLCTAFRTGREVGHEEAYPDAYRQGWDACYPVAYTEGQANCPLPHGGGVS